jgi:PhoPQ-activated pathogenicity-related protein
MISMNKVDSIYNFSEKLIGERFIFNIDSAQHEDFSCLLAIVRESGKCKTSRFYSTALNLTLPFLEDHLKNEHLFSHAIEQEINKTITKN